MGGSHASLRESLARPPSEVQGHRSPSPNGRLEASRPKLRFRTGTTDGWGIHSSREGVGEPITRTDSTGASEAVEVPADIREVGGPFPLTDQMVKLNSEFTIEMRLLLWSRIATSVTLPATEMDTTTITMATLWMIVKCLVPASGGATGVSLPR